MVDALKKSLAQSWSGNLSDEPGLQDVSVPDAMTVYGAGKLAAGGADILANALAPNGVLRNEVGAIFPEGAPLPKDQQSLKELSQILPDSQQNYLRNQALENWHAGNADWPRVLQDKWALLTHSGGN
jgi:hypothetical protein